jgi:hypothetical protein
VAVGGRMCARAREEKGAVFIGAGLAVGTWELHLKGREEREHVPWVAGGRHSGARSGRWLRATHGGACPQGGLLRQRARVMVARLGWPRLGRGVRMLRPDGVCQLSRGAPGAVQSAVALPQFHLPDFDHFKLKFFECNFKTAKKQSCRGATGE